jgi:hypothetical protein
MTQTPIAFYLHIGLMASEDNLNYWCSELESLGLKVRLNEFNDKSELSNFVAIIKRKLYQKYKQVYS